MELCWQRYEVILRGILDYFVVYKSYFVVGDFFVELLGPRVFILLFMSLCCCL
jgi:hypothetical protein